MMELKCIVRSDNGEYTGIVDSEGLEGITPAHKDSIAFANVRAMANISTRDARAFLGNFTDEELAAIDKCLAAKDYFGCADLIIKNEKVKWSRAFD